MFPEFVLVGEVDGTEVGYCDSIVRRAESRQDWVDRMNEDNPQNLQSRTQNCIIHYNLSKADLHSINQHFNQTQGVSSRLSLANGFIPAAVFDNWPKIWIH